MFTEALYLGSNLLFTQLSTEMLEVLQIFIILVFGW